MVQNGRHLSSLCSSKAKGQDGMIQDMVSGFIGNGADDVTSHRVTGLRRAEFVKRDSDLLVEKRTAGGALFAPGPKQHKEAVWTLAPILPPG